MSSLEYAIIVIGGVYLLLLGVPIGIYLDRGRSSGKIGPKAGATIMAMILVGIPAIGAMTYAAVTRHLPISIYWLVLPLGVFIVWIIAYAGPIGAGWLGKWDHYVYPQKGGKPCEKGGTPLPTTASGDAGRPGLLRSWRAFTSAIIVSALVVFVASGIALSKPLLALFGIALALLYSIASLLFWRWKKDHLKAQGWHW